MGKSRVMAVAMSKLRKLLSKFTLGDARVDALITRLYVASLRKWRGRLSLVEAEQPTPARLR